MFNFCPESGCEWGAFCVCLEISFYSCMLKCGGQKIELGNRVVYCHQ